MEFDKSRVYTAVNADELRVGSKCIFADSLATLKARVETENPRIRILEEIEKENYTNRFIWNDSYNCYYMNLAYLIEPPVEPKYKPFEDFNNMADAVRKHGDDIKTKTGKCKGYIVGMGLKGHVIINGMFGLCYFCSTKELFEGYVFADDCSPCGELVEK